MKRTLTFGPVLKKSAAVLALLQIMLFIGIYQSINSDSFNWQGFIFVLFFYLLIFALGIFASEFRKSSIQNDLILANRSMPIFVASLSMGATWVGGGYINGSAEFASTAGLAWVQAPWAYALSLIVGGLFFVKPMRRAGYTTMLDPLHERFGKKMTALLFLPAFTGELFWTAAILVALGTTFATILGVDSTSAIIISAAVAIIYTMIGGLWSVAITDVVQMLFILGSLALVAPLVVSNVGGWELLFSKYTESMGSLARIFPPSNWASDPNWGNTFWYWLDLALLLIFGGVAWQVYFQRVLAAKDDKTARNLSLFGGLFCIIAAIPAIIIGMVGHITDWSQFGVEAPEGSMTLPYVVYYLSSPIVGVIALAAVAAAVMSSTDSSILSSSTMMVWNIYRPFIQKDVPIQEDKFSRIIKRSIVIIGVTAMLLALRVKSVYALWVLCSDFVYTILFPQLVAALFFKKANTYGSAAGFVLSFLMRFGGGEPAFGLPMLIPYPLYDEQMGITLFPYKTVTMLASLLTIYLVSVISDIFSKRK